MPRTKSFAGRFLAVILAAALIAPAPYAAAEQRSKATSSASKSFAGRLPIRDLSEEEATLHAMNRLGFGPRPGDIARVRAMGLEKWVEQQLQPESLDDSAVAKRLERYPTLAMSTEKLFDEFPRPEVAARRAGMTPEEYRKQLEAQQRQREERQRMMEERQQAGEMDPAARRPLRDMDPNSIPARMEDVRAPARIVAELSMAKLTRAVYSERQLEEMMVDFWFNHFNVFAGKGPDRWLLTSYERDVLRPNAMSKFRDLLGATAQSPAMLFYLDNWQSADPEAFARLEKELNNRRQRFNRLFGNDPRMDQRLMQRGQLGQQQPGKNPQAQQQRMRRGLNENYARELMELHTLGVDGGYTQQDIIEVARAFTGWTLRAPRVSAEFYFDTRIHDPKPKIVLGKKIDAGGIKDGQAILDLLARHPNTAKFVSTKIARRFVSDTPPAALVQRMAKKFLESDGDIRAVLRTMVYSPEFWSREVYRAKIKRPFELVASATRAVGADVQVPLPLVMWAGRIGEPLYQCQPPTGYSDKSEAWVNTGALLNRMNFALSLAGGGMRGARVELGALLGEEASRDPQAALARAIDVFLAGQASPQTRATLEKQLGDPQVLRATLDDRVQQVDVGVVAGLVLGSPEFQRR
jgi:uncharacterized protein (DUF1800 family)